MVSNKLSKYIFFSLVLLLLSYLFISYFIVGGDEDDAEEVYSDSDGGNLDAVIDRLGNIEFEIGEASAGPDVGEASTGPAQLPDHLVDHIFGYDRDMTDGMIVNHIGELPESLSDRIHGFLPNQLGYYEAAIEEFDDLINVQQRYMNEFFILMAEWYRTDGSNYSSSIIREDHNFDFPKIGSQWKHYRRSFERWMQDKFVELNESTMHPGSVELWEVMNLNLRWRAKAHTILRKISKSREALEAARSKIIKMRNNLPFYRNQLPFYSNQDISNILNRLEQRENEITALLSNLEGVRMDILEWLNRSADFVRNVPQVCRPGDPSAGPARRLFNFFTKYSKTKPAVCRKHCKECLEEFSEETCEDLCSNLPKKGRGRIPNVDILGRPETRGRKRRR